MQLNHLSIPVSQWFYNKKNEDWDWKNIKHTENIENIMSKFLWLRQICSLGWWNHFIEIAQDENATIWIVIHSWSRGIGHKTATFYMQKAKQKSIDTSKLENEFEKKNQDLKKYNLEKFEERKYKWVEDQAKKRMGKNLEWHHWFQFDSEIWEQYYTDMNFCLEFALENRKRMMRKTFQEINYHINGNKDVSIDFDELEEKWDFINRNHNHAELKNDTIIHRKWATHAEKWMYWVIPGNMRDGSFIVQWKWNTLSLSSSSHGAWRVMSRIKAKKNLNIDEFTSSMKWITAKVDKDTIDESPFAYKNIFEVMDLQKELVETKHHLTPIINIKG